MPSGGEHGGRYGEGEIRAAQAACEHRDDRACGPRQDDADLGLDEGERGAGHGEVHQLRRGGQGFRVAGAAGSDEDPDDCDQPRGVRDREAALRARGLSGARRLREEHDHGGGADGWGDSGGQCGGRADAADARAHPAGAPGGGALHRGVSERGGQGGRQGGGGPGGAGGARVALEVRVSGGQDSGDHGGGDEGPGGGRLADRGAGAPQAAGGGGHVHSDAEAGGGQAVFDAERGGLHDQRAGHGGDGALRAGDREGGRRGGDRGAAAHAEHGGDGGGDVPQGAR